MKLSERNLAALPAPEKGNKVYYDLEGRGNVRGFGLRVTEAGARSWTLDYSDTAGKRRRATLARWPDLSLAQARIRAGQFHAAMAKGEAGPLEAKRVAREQARGEQLRREREKTVAELVELWMTTYARLHKRATSLKNDRSILGAHILPALGATNVAEVTRDDVRKLHASLSDKRVQANRVHYVVGREG